LLYNYEERLEIIIPHKYDGIEVQFNTIRICSIQFFALLNLLSPFEVRLSSRFRYFSRSFGFSILPLGFSGLYRK
jgi:hypothetical protein